MITVTELADELKTNRTNVWFHVRKHKLGAKRGGVLFLSKEEADIVRSHMLKHQEKSGYVTVKQIMDETGLSRETITRRVRKIGVKSEERTRIFLTEEQARMVKEDVR